jgi:predicted RNA-binding protein with PUA-like domain
MRYWLMKSEPDCYSIDDLERDGTAMWEGCRNYTVRNYIRDFMQIGDQAFFYHSNADPSGVVGTMEVVSEPYPDPTQFEPESQYYDAKSKESDPRWLVRDVKFLTKFPRVISLKELKETPGLEAMAVNRKGQRLSITEVSPAEWNIVLGLANKS